MWVISPPVNQDFSTSGPHSANPLDSLTHEANRGIFPAANPGWASEQKKPNSPDLFLHWACSSGPGHHGGPCSQGNNSDAEHSLSYHQPQEGFWIFLSPPLRISWRHQSDIICCTRLALISIYKYVILPTSGGDYQNLRWNELQEIRGTGKWIELDLGWNCRSLQGNEDVTQLWSLDGALTLILWRHNLHYAWFVI